VIFDDEMQIFAVHRAGQLDRTIDGTEIDGVLQQIRQRLKEQESIGLDHDRFILTIGEFSQVA